MPLPPLPGHTTPRFRLNYTAGSLAHSIIGHQALQTTGAQALSHATDLANLLKVVQYADTVYTSVDFAEAGSDIFNNVGTISIAGTVAGAAPLYTRPLYLSFAGRGLSGRKTRLFVFGTGPQNDNSWRITTAENATIANIVTGLNSQVGALALIDASSPISWKPYANYGSHDRYVKKIRRTG